MVLRYLIFQSIYSKESHGKHLTTMVVFVYVRCGPRRAPSRDPTPSSQESVFFVSCVLRGSTFGVVLKRKLREDPRSVIFGDAAIYVDCDYFKLIQG